MSYDDDEQEQSAQVFTAIIAVVILIAITTYLFYARVIHDWTTAGIAIAAFLVYVVVCVLIAPYVIASAPSKSQSGYDQSNFQPRTYYGSSGRVTNRIPPAGYLFALIMPGYFIGQAVIWVWGKIAGGGDGKKK